MSNRDILFIDFDVRIGIGAAVFIQQQRFTDYVVAGTCVPLVYLQQATVGRQAARLAN